MAKGKKKVISRKHKGAGAKYQEKLVYNCIWVSLKQDRWWYFR